VTPKYVVAHPALNLIGLAASGNGVVATASNDEVVTPRAVDGAVPTQDAIVANRAYDDVVPGRSTNESGFGRALRFQMVQSTRRHKPTTVAARQAAVIRKKIIG
jgi:hypothetical protein